LAPPPPQQAAASRLLRAGPPASAATGTQCLRFSASARFLSRPLGPATPDDCFDARLLTFRARAADQDHAASTPGTTWPATRAPARLISEGKQGPPISMPSRSFRRFNSARPTRDPPGATLSGTSSWSPPDPVKPSLFPGRSPRQSSANAAPGWFSACPRRADAGGPILHHLHSIAYVQGLLHGSR